jgi:diguanylate cyclase
MTHHASHDPYLVILSVTIAIFGAYTALDLFRRVHVTDGRARTAWLATAAVAMGLSIWSMHFVAVLAFDAGVPVSYHLGLIALSLLVAVAVTGAAFATVVRPDPDRVQVLAAGLFMGLGIAGMHYLGMAAMQLPARLTYDALLVALSLLIAAGASTAALVLVLREQTPVSQVAGAVAAGLAIAGMHYVAMLALTLVPAAGGAAPGPEIDAPGLAFNVAAATFSLLVLALTAAGFDRRLAALALDKAAVLRQARDELELRVEERTRDLADANAHLATEVIERRRAEAELRRARDELELRVEERTRALASANTRLEAEVAERRRAEVDLRSALDRLARHMDNTPLGVVEVALGPGEQAPDRVRSWSGQAEAIFGWRAEEVLGRSLDDLALFHEGDADKVALVRRDLTAGGRRHATATLRCYNRDHDLRHCCLYASIVRADGGAPATMLLLVEDVTERLATLENVQRLAHHDTLTGLPNRLLFQDRLEQALRVAGRQDQGVALMLLDLDHFKDVNDSLGHPAGDQLLREVAERLAGGIRATDTWARLGGDEFALVQTGARGSKDAEVMVQRVLGALRPPFTVEGQRVHVSASLGVTLFPDDGATSERLMRNADMALYRAKADGRRSGAFYRPEMDRELQASRSLQSGLRHALEHGGLGLVYQPVFDVRGRQVVAVEALLRWRHPGGGEVPPATFIPIAEASGLIQPLGAWTLQQACRQAAAWRGAGLKVAVNVSVAQLRDPEFLPTLRRAIRAAGILAASLELEVTESVFLDPSKDLIVGTLHEIAALGVALAIDDFGAGYSSLGYLKHLPFDKVKIDGSFVRDIGRDRESTAIVAAVIALGHTLGKRVTAEGVEEEAQFAFLAECGCDLAQGYLLGRPQPAEAINPVLARDAA